MKWSKKEYDIWMRMSDNDKLYFYFGKVECMPPEFFTPIIIEYLDGESDSIFEYGDEEDEYIITFVGNEEPVNDSIMGMSMDGLLMVGVGNRILEGGRVCRVFKAYDIRVPLGLS